MSILFQNFIFKTLLPSIDWKKCTIFLSFKENCQKILRSFWDNWKFIFSATFKSLKFQSKSNFPKIYIFWDYMSQVVHDCKAKGNISSVLLKKRMISQSLMKCLLLSCQHAYLCVYSEHLYPKRVRKDSRYLPNIHTISTCHFVGCCLARSLTVCTVTSNN